ncbi:MAG: hypothetical protein PWP68_1462 [Rikenellaceae bacterium]|nr:hypothetical protein [Rikenellaceae bacterium]
MMAKKEWTPENWKWDEEKIRKYLEEFEKYLNSKEGQDILEKRREKLKMAQELLKDDESIESLTSEKLSSLLKTLDASIRSPVPARIMRNEEYFKEFKAWLKSLIKINPGDQLPEKKPDDIGIAYTTELLTLRNPKEFYLINNASIYGLRKLGFGKLPSNDEKSYPKWRPLFDELKEKLKKIIEKNLYKEVDYYDVDNFLYFVHQQNKKSEENKSDESQDKNKESAINAETDKKSETEKQKKEPEVLLRHYFQYKGFYFDQDLITAFYAALKTKGFVILSGLTGTGKTKLAQLFAELLCPKCNPPDKQNTQIPQASPENQNQNRKCTHLFLSVRPDWRDSKALLGYYNPITKEYERTPLLDYILNAINNYLDAINNYNTKKDDPVPYFIILDEMNLSHVEYYFADFLSVLESGRDQHGWTKETIKLHNVDSNNVKEPKEINLPPNLYIIGSVNIDETTYMFSPKVLDRAFTIEFREVDFDSYNPFEIDEKKAKSIAGSIRDVLLEDLRNKKNENEQARFCGAVADKEEIKEALNWIKNEENKVRSGNLIFDELKELNQILQLYDLHFGYRVLDEIALFIKYATDPSDKVTKLVGKLSPENAIDFALFMKVLPKFHGPRQKLERPLWSVLKWCAKNPDEFENVKPEEIKNLLEDLLTGKEKRSEKFNYPRTALKVLTMLRQLYETGFASFA